MHDGSLAPSVKRYVLVKVPVVVTEKPIVPKISHNLKTFDGQGGSSVRTWLQRYEAVRVPLCWDNRRSIALCAMHLRDRAQQWYTEE